MGTIETTCLVMRNLICGHVYDRRSLAKDLGVTVASADRYLRALADVPGVSSRRHGRILLVSFAFSDAMKAIGR